MKYENIIKPIVCLLFFPVLLFALYLFASFVNWSWLTLSPNDWVITRLILGIGTVVTFIGAYTNN